MKLFNKCYRLITEYHPDAVIRKIEGDHRKISVIITTPKDHILIEVNIVDGCIVSTTETLKETK